MPTKEGALKTIKNALSEHAKAYKGAGMLMPTKDDPFKSERKPAAKAPAGPKTLEEVDDFDEFMIEGKAYGVNPFGDTINEDAEYMGHFNRRTEVLDRKAKPPAYWNEWVMATRLGMSLKVPVGTYKVKEEKKEEFRLAPIEPTRFASIDDRDKAYLNKTYETLYKADMALSRGDLTKAKKHLKDGLAMLNEAL